MKTKLKDFLLERYLEDGDIFYSIEHDDWWGFIDAIKKGADLDKPGEDGYTPMLSCIMKNEPRMLVELINAGADVYAFYEFKSSDPDDEDFDKDYEVADTWDLICKLMPQNKDKILKVILKKHPDFFKGREQRKAEETFGI